MTSSSKKDDGEWIAPVLGLLGVAGAFVASMLFSNANQNNNSLNNSTLPPPPPAGKPSGCGCQHKKT